MKAHLAKIYNFTCDRNPNHWWSVDGIEPLRGQVLFCPHCGHRNVVEEILDHTVQLDPIERIFENELPSIDDMVGILNVEDDQQIDTADLQDAIAAREEAQREGTIPWEQLKSELNLDDADDIE